MDPVIIQEIIRLVSALVVAIIGGVVSLKIAGINKSSKEEQTGPTILGTVKK
jgi:hypothetical protein